MKQLVRFLVIIILMVTSVSNSGVTRLESLRDSIGQLYLVQSHSILGSTNIYGINISSYGQVLNHVKSNHWRSWDDSERSVFVYSYLDIIGIWGDRTVVFVDFLRAVGGSGYIFKIYSNSGGYRYQYYGDNARGERVIDRILFVKSFFEE